MEKTKLKQDTTNYLEFLIRQFKFIELQILFKARFGFKGCWVFVKLKRKVSPNGHYTINRLRVYLMSNFNQIYLYLHPICKTGGTKLIWPSVPNPLTQSMVPKLNIQSPRIHILQVLQKILSSDVYIEWDVMSSELSAGIRPWISQWCTSQLSSKNPLTKKKDEREDSSNKSQLKYLLRRHEMLQTLQTLL